MFSRTNDPEQVRTAYAACEQQVERQRQGQPVDRRFEYALRGAAKLRCMEDRGFILIQVSDAD